MFIRGDGTNDYNSIWEKTIDHLSIIDANQKFRNVLFEKEFNRVLKVYYHVWERYQANKVSSAEVKQMIVLQ